MANQRTLEHPRFRRLREYLRAKAPPGKLPGRQHIDPTELGDLLPYLMLLDVAGQPTGGPRFRIRLAGTRLVQYHGREVTGQFVEDVLSDPQATLFVAGYRDIVRTRVPEHRRSMVAVPGREHVTYERMTFPLARDGEHVDMLISVFVVESEK